MKKFLYSNKFKSALILIFLLCLYILISAYSYANEISNDLSENIFRLHVIANSDSAEDQNLKYLVRDNLIQYMSSISSNVNSKEEAMDLISKHIIDFEEIANQTIKENGFSYNATVEIGKFEFPTKTYSDISFPSGIYDALEVRIGKAQGQNWWCVLYPALCFIDTSSGALPDESKYELKENLSEEEYKIISDKETPVINFKFKIIEFFTNNNIFTAKNN